jgi:signal transduction histidine kinase
MAPVTELTEAAAGIRPSRRAAAGGTAVAVAWAVGAVVVGCAVAGVLLELERSSTTVSGRDYWPLMVAVCLAYGLPGALLLASGHAPRIAAITASIGVVFGLTVAGTGVAVANPDVEPLVWLVSWIWIPAYCAVFLLLLYLPDGRLPSRRWRPLAIVAPIAIAAMAIGTALGPYPLDDLPAAYGDAQNPLEVDAVGRALLAAGAVVFVPCAALSLLALVLRLRRSRGADRDRLKWVALGGALTVVLLGSAFLVGDAGDVVVAVAVIPLPTSVAIAVLRHRMWDVDLVINRSLVYGALTALVVLAYVALVALASQLLDETAAGLVAVGVVAVVLHPVHARLQQAANQLMYGDRDDPGAALRRLGDRLVAAGEPDDVLPAVAETVARALRLPYVTVALADGVEPAAAGVPPRDAGELMRVALFYRGERVGELSAAPREPGRGFSVADRRALETIGRQVAVAAHAVRLTDDLRRSRERLVLAREEERRRLRRDLHDELGPTLAALALEIESARDRVEGEPAEVLDRAAGRAREGVDDVRRIVYELRPPTLDDLGLPGALRERAAQLASDSLAIDVDVPADVGPLSAAVEAAVYRIASEALANAARHSGARRAQVTLAVAGGALELRVVDDGAGIDPDATPGVGLGSMRERAEELGGTLAVGERAGGGSEIRARLPLEGR